MDRQEQKYPKSPPNTTLVASALTSSEPEATPFSMETVAFPTTVEEFEAFSSSFALTPVAAVPQPLECLQGNPIPPFLSKTFDLVDDTSLDPIISWGSTGESFVVWDPVEFSRLILPRNFKHNNFSSFVRQLNTYGFRKIDTDRWEFANEAFQRGKKHLLKNIQRRKSPQSQQIGTYIGPFSEAGKSGVQGDIEQLRKERSMLMQEVVELHQQHRGTASHMEAVNQRIQAAEQRQKQMVSFLAKLLQNPAFLARLKQKKEQGEIGSSRMKRKFVKHQPHEMGKSDSSVEGQIVKYRPDWGNLTIPNVVPESHQVPVEQSPDYLIEGMVGIGSGEQDMPFQFENVASVGLAVSDELAVPRGFTKAPKKMGEGASSSGIKDLHFKEKNVMSPHQEIRSEYFVSYPEDLMKEKNIHDFSSPGIECIARQEDIWNMGFDATAGMFSSSTELLGNLATSDVPDLGTSGGLSDLWDLSSLQAAGGSGIDLWSADEPPFVDPGSQAGPKEDDRHKDMDP